METEILQGTIEAVVFQNYDNGYCVLRLKCDNGQTITVVGTIPLPCVGEQLMVTGRWTSHPSYGKQFEAEFLERLMPSTTPEILKYLSGRAIKGIGPRFAARIVGRFGDDTLKVMEQEPHRLAEISGISLKKAQEIGEAFRLQVGLRHLMEFFTLHQLPVELSVQTYRLYGEKTIELLYDDPYILMDDDLDAPFHQVDRFAVELGVSADDPRRVEAGLLFELKYNLSAGHTFLPVEKLFSATSMLLSVSEAVVAEAANRLLQAGRLTVDTLADIRIAYLPTVYHAELYCTHALLQHADKVFPSPKRLEKLLLQAQTHCGIDFSQQQKEAIEAAATSGLLLVTGGPGTGKTTIVNGILSLFDLMGLRCLMAAPTGRAAKRITEVTGREASTIHRLLETEVDPRSGKPVFLRDEDYPLEADAIIVDEMSMVDVSLLHHLLQAVPANMRLIFVGDPDQLPPVGPGFPFSDMLRSNRIAAVRLTEIFRQAQESRIVTNAHLVNKGQMPCLNDVKNDFFFLPVRSEEAVGQTIVGLCSTRLPKNMGIPSDQIQVLTPTKKGGAGTVHLNKILQASLNPPAPNKKERQFGETIFREGDRVMQIRNNYDILWKKVDGSVVGSGIFNGDIGIIRSIDLSMETMVIHFDDRETEYEFSQLNELELAYAMTVHKSQGSEYRAVVLSAWNGSQYLLNRSVLYTAITRARELLVIVGREETIAVMVQNGKVSKRYTGLKLRLQGKD